VGLVIGRFGVFNCYEFTDVTEARLRAKLCCTRLNMAQFLVTRRVSDETG
jgi:hypothetical protein